MASSITPRQSSEIFTSGTSVRRVTVEIPQVGGEPEFTNRPGDIETPPASTACLPANRRDHNGQALAYVYFKGELDHRSAAHLLTRDEARRIAAKIAKLPKLLLNWSNP